MYNRMIEREALRLEKEAEERRLQESEDWTEKYKGLNGRILSALWHAPRHRLITTKICDAGWKRAVPDNTLYVTIWRINRQLKKDNCPYFLKSIPNGKTGDVKGYGLRKLTLQKLQK